MLDLKKEMSVFNYREFEVPLAMLFPKLNLETIRMRFQHLKQANPHETIYLISRALSEGGYEFLIEEQGFWDSAFAKFTGHANQCVPILGLVLTALGFECSFLDCYQVNDHIAKTGMIDQTMPSAEKDLKKKMEWMKIKRIPYCILEVNIKNQLFYISGKHLSAQGDHVHALLKPNCYINFTGVFRHQDDSNKSGIYIAPIIPQHNLQKANFQKQILWAKQTYNDEHPEYFLTFLRMKLLA